MAKELIRAMSKIQEAGTVLDVWPEAMESLTDALGIEGAACIVFNKQTKGVDWACFSGLSAELEAKYVKHYASLDPFSPLLYVLPGWTKLSECFSSSVLEKSEWYNDFVLACGVRDALGTRLAETPTHSAIFGLHRQIGRSLGDKPARIVDGVTGTLSSAVKQSIERLFGTPRAGAGTGTVGQGTRYYFHIQNGSEYSDQTGCVFADDGKAIAHASVLAAELKQDEDWAGLAVCVVDEGGRLVARMPMG